MDYEDAVKNFELLLVENLKGRLIAHMRRWGDVTKEMIAISDTAKALWDQHLAS